MLLASARNSPSSNRDLHIRRRGSDMCASSRSLVLYMFLRWRIERHWVQCLVFDAIVLRQRLRSCERVLYMISSAYFADECGDMTHIANVMLDSLVEARFNVA